MAMIACSSAESSPFFAAPKGRRLVARWRKPLDSRGTLNTEPCKGERLRGCAIPIKTRLVERTSTRDALSPLPGLRIDGIREFQGLTALAIDCRPSGPSSKLITTVGRRGLRTERSFRANCGQAVQHEQAYS